MNIPYVMKRCTKCGRWLVASKANFNKQKGGKYGLKSQCKKRLGKQYKQWCETNEEKVLERQKQYYKDNKEKRIEYQKQYYEANKEKVLEQQKQYKKSPQGKAVNFNSNNKRRHKKEAQGTGITGEQWLEMMQYFDFRCAYTGERLTDKTRTVDHIVPIDAGGDDMVWNMVPMTRSLNSSKWKKDMLEWYKKQPFYSEARLAKIYEWQEYARKKWKNS